METQMSYKLAPLMTIHKKVFLCMLLGQMACSYALGIAGTALTQASGPLGLNSFWIGLIGAGTLIGLMGSIVVGNLADHIGRRILFNLDMILFTFISLAQFFVVGPVSLFILRIALGLMIAIDYTVGSALLTEWLPDKLAAKFQSYLIIFWSIGFVASYFVGSAMTNLGSEMWKWIFMSSALFGAVAAIVRIVLNVPESPEWLTTVGKKQEALKLIHTQVGAEYSLPIVEQGEAEKVSWSELFNKHNRMNTLVGSVFYGCQVFPYFGVSIFIPILVKNMNMGNSGASGTIYNIFVVVGAIVGVIFFDRVSRRAFLLTTFYVPAVAVIGMIILQNAPIVITIILFSIFALGMAASVVAENPYPPELFSARLRASGVGAVIAISRIGAALGTFLLPIIVDRFSAYTALGVCAAVLLCGGLFCQLYAPETSSK
ncbi:MFS transporter [Candidatus Enterococcus ferrettii]|uniref:Major facilitator superfamily (MFS) profile domain-containing protein n=1 Tax=Candidatus Enterococcus ferrettii TaxID=2815324 RepID=A0ABV0ESD3_9ENTE|nr:MFS transporter [Enterococcus sp. 665A]